MGVRPTAPEGDTTTFPDRLLFMAEEDLDASAILYEAGHYPQSVFLLQQAVEKAAKSFSICFRIITEDEAVRQIQHRPLNIVRKTAKTITQGLRSIPGEPRAMVHLSSADFDLPQFIKSIDATEREIDTYLNSLETFDLSEADASGLVTTLKETHDVFESILQPIEKEGIPEFMYDQMSVYLEQFFRSFYASSRIPETEKEEMIQKIPEITREILGKRDQLETFLFVIMDTVESMLLLFHLARATGPHAIKARYPDTKTGFDPLAYYTPDRPIVAAIPDLHTHTGIVLERLDRLYDFIASPPEIADLTTTCDPRVTLPTHQEGHP
jgi:HEPN domain-containing protein